MSKKLFPTIGVLILLISIVILSLSTNLNHALASGVPVYQYDQSVTNQSSYIISRNNTSTWDWQVDRPGNPNGPLHYKLYRTLPLLDAPYAYAAKIHVGAANGGNYGQIEFYGLDNNDEWVLISHLGGGSAHSNVIINFQGYYKQVRIVGLLSCNIAYNGYSTTQSFSNVRFEVHAVVSGQQSLEEIRDHVINAKNSADLARTEAVNAKNSAGNLKLLTHQLIPRTMNLK